jgi:hypothetical protein
MRFAVATNCTNRKRFAPSRALQGRYLPQATAKEVADEWVRRIKSAEAVSAAAELYQGRAFAEAKAAARSLEADLYIVSAGLGLVHSRREVPSYNLTVTERSSNNVLHRCTDVPAAEDWWQAVNASFQTQSLSSRIARSAHDYWLIAIPKTYYRMLRNDLARLDKKDLARIRLFGPREDAANDVVLQRTLISLDDRLDGPDSDIRGTRSDFAQRAMAFFIRNVLMRKQDGDVASHRRATAGLLGNMAWPKQVPKRAPATDDQICKRLDQFWKKGNGQSTKLLRVLRDDLLIACEESRFRKLFHFVAQRRGVQ